MKYKVQGQTDLRAAVFSQWNALVLVTDPKTGGDEKADSLHYAIIDTMLLT